MNIKSISIKTLVTLILTIILTFSFFLYLFIYSNRTKELRQISINEQEILTRLQTVSSILYSFEPDDKRKGYVEQFFHNEMDANLSIQSITLYDTKKSLMLRFERNEDWLPVSVKVEPKFQYDPRIINIAKEEIVVDDQKKGNIEVIFSDKAIKEKRFSYFSDFLFTLLFIIVFSSLVIFLFLEVSVIHPLKMLIKHIQQYRKSGYVSATLVSSLSSEDEIGLLIQEFNDLMMDLTKSFQHKAFLIRQLELSNEEMQQEVKKRIYTEECEHAAQEYMNTVFNLVPAMLVIVNEELMVIQQNEQMHMFTKKDCESANLFPLSEILPFTENITDLLFNNLKNHKVQTFQCCDNDKYYAVTLNPFEYRGEVRGIIRLDDITNFIIKENELLDNFRIEDTKKILRNITCDFNNLLCEIMGANFLAKFELDSLPEEKTELKDMLEVIEKASKRSCNLIKKLSFVSNWNENETSEVDLRDLLNNILSILSPSIPPEIALNFTDNLNTEKAVIQGNVYQLEQIFLSLILNAINAMTVQRKNGDLWQGDLKINLARKIVDNGNGTEYYCVEIQDSGIGIDYEKLKAILDSSYVDEDTKGKNMSLTICKNLIKRHNGWLSAESEPDKGSIFRVYLPIMEKKADKDENITMDLDSGKTILVIDDNEMLLKVTGQMLSKCGYKVLLADNGSDGIEIFRNNNQISIVLLDLIMPEMSGLEVFNKLKELRDDIAVIFMSGASEKRELANCCGYNGFLTKPYSLNELSGKIFEVIKNSIDK